MKPYHNQPEIAFGPAETIAGIQQQRLRELIAYLAVHSPFYREKLQGIDADSFTLADLAGLPVTTKADIQTRNWDFLCVPRQQVAEYMATSGTLGNPVTVALTANDLDRLSYNEYISFITAGGSAADVYQLMLTLDRQFMAGIAYYMGIRRLGAAQVRVGPGAPAMHWETIQRVQPTVLVGVPSFLIKLIEFAGQQGIDLSTCPVKTVVCIGESIRNPDGSLNRLGSNITSRWPVTLVSTYASTEMQTAFTECRAGKGGHLNAELLVVELLDDNNQSVPDGEPGEVTITTLGVEGMPLLRYKTGDICVKLAGPCTCGRHTPRLSGVLGRKQQMIKLKGTSFYPPALFDLLHQVAAVRDYAVELQANEYGTDEVLLHLQITGAPEETARELKDLLRSRLRVIPDIRFVSSQELHLIQFPDGGRKALKLIDRR